MSLKVKDGGPPMEQRCICQKNPLLHLKQILQQVFPRILSKPILNKMGSIFYEKRLDAVNGFFNCNTCNIIRVRQTTWDILFKASISFMF